MIPAHAPFPTDCSLPFQPPPGIQTSILISESLVGFRVAATRQNAGRLLYTAPAFGPRPGGAGNAPASTGIARVMAACGKGLAATSSHRLAATASTGKKTSKTRCII